MKKKTRMFPRVGSRAIPRSTGSMGGGVTLPTSNPRNGRSRKRTQTAAINGNKAAATSTGRGAKQKPAKRGGPTSTRRAIWGNDCLAFRAEMDSSSGQRSPTEERGGVATRPPWLCLLSIPFSSPATRCSLRTCRRSPGVCLRATAEEAGAPREGRKREGSGVPLEASAFLFSLTDKRQSQDRPH